MKIKSTTLLLSLLALCAAFASCSDSKSYAELLEEENKTVNRFLADQRVIGYQEDFKDFEVGPEAPYYQLDKEGNMYMQVVRKGTDGMAEDNQLIYFRFTRWNLNNYVSGEEMTDGEGNSSTIEYGDQSFRYNNTTLESTTQWGSGIQYPLSLVPLGSEINIVIKSQYGWTAEISYVMPFLYNLRYFPSKI